jgi:hypothetical protein
MNAPQNLLQKATPTIFTLLPNIPPVIRLADAVIPDVSDLAMVPSDRPRRPVRFFFPCLHPLTRALPHPSSFKRNQVELRQINGPSNKKFKSQMFLKTGKNIGKIHEKYLGKHLPKIAIFLQKTTTLKAN